MKLIIDIGNTNTKLAIFDRKQLLRNKVINSYDLVKIKIFVNELEIRSVIVSCVKELSDDIMSISNYYKNTIFFSVNTRLPIINKYKSPLTLGKDRLAGAVGANYLYPNSDILVIDAGTCLTIDFINSNSEYLGGRISPGISMRFKSLNTFTDKLPLVKQEKTLDLIGEDTKNSILTGVMHGILAEVRMIISDYMAKNSQTISVVTGGDCFFFEKELKNSIFAQPNLVLIGLNEILDYNE